MHQIFWNINESLLCWRRAWIVKFEIPPISGESGKKVFNIFIKSSINSKIISCARLCQNTRICFCYSLFKRDFVEIWNHKLPRLNEILSELALISLKFNKTIPKLFFSRKSIMRKSTLGVLMYQFSFRNTLLYWNFI